LPVVFLEWIIFVPCPGDEVVEFPVDELCIEDGLYFPFQFVLDDDRWWRELASPGNSMFRRRLGEGHVEYRVDGPVSRRKFEFHR
jgi:hypothetical protein